MAYVRKARKFVKKARKFVKKVNKHPVTKGIASIAKIANMVKLFNVEKKRVDFNFAGSYQSFAQTNVPGTSGALSIDITPVIPQGITGSTRNGNSIKLTSGCLDLYFTQQANTINKMMLKYFLVCVPDNSVNLSPATLLTNMLEPNPFLGIIDYHSSRDPEFFTSMRIIKQGIVTLQADQLATGVAYAQKKIPLKLNHHLKYNTDASTTTTKNKFFLVFTADTGDKNGGSLTGAFVGFNMRYYYVDN